jgi:hypothetical protein
MQNLQMYGPDVLMVSMGENMVEVEQGIARATAGAVYVTYTVSPPGSNNWNVRYANIRNYIEDHFGHTLRAQTPTQGVPGLCWTEMIDYLSSTPPFNLQLWPYRLFGLAKRLRRPASPVDASAER